MECSAFAYGFNSISQMKELLPKAIEENGVLILKAINSGLDLFGRKNPRKVIRAALSVDRKSATDEEIVQYSLDLSNDEAFIEASGTERTAMIELLDRNVPDMTADEQNLEAGKGEPEGRDTADSAIEAAEIRSKTENIPYPEALAIEFRERG